MKKILYFIISVMGATLLDSCTSHPATYKYDASPNSVFKQCAHNAFENYQWLSFSIEKKEIFNGKQLKPQFYQVSFFYDSIQPSIYISLDDMILTYKITKDTLKKVDGINMELSAFIRSETDSLHVYENIKANVENKIAYINSFYQSVFTDIPPYGDVDIKTIKDTILPNGIHCYRFEGLDELRVFENCDTGEKDELQYICTYWINKETSQIDSLIMSKTNSTPYTDTIIFVISNINHEQRQNYYDQIFNYDQTSYDGFTIHNEKHLPFSMIGSNLDNTSLELLNYPLINLKNDTTTINNYHSWLLLNFWSFNCPTCINELKEWGEEKDSLGYRPLEKNGITILSINYNSNNINLIKQVSTKTNSDDIMFSAKGINQHISLPYLGYNYLLSPQKEIVYRSTYIGHKGNYSELLEAKANYEKLHHK
jgi:hypothetical protein